MFFRRLIFEAIPTLCILAVLTFLALRFVPGGPFDGDRAWPPEIQRHLEQKYGLDLPIATQFLRWARDLAHGDLGASLQYLDQPVTTMIARSLPVSALLGSLALLLSVPLGLVSGTVAAWKQGTWVDSCLRLAMMSALSLPAFLPASILILIFASGLGWLPPALWEGPSSWVLPVVTLAIRPAAIIARLARVSTLESLGADYVRTALAKGLSVRAAVFRHALRNSLIPVLSQLGQIAAHLLTGSFLVETLFQIPGLGTHFVGAVLNRDYPLVMGLTLTYGTILVLCNLGVDFAYAWADPRIHAPSD
jgi:oligopeptide transport system permease protein